MEGIHLMMMEPIKSEHIERFNRLPGYVRVFLDHPWLRRFALPFTPATVGAYSAYAAAITGNPILLVITAGGAGYTWWYVKRYLKLLEPQDITGDGAKEPVFAQQNIFGSRTPNIFDEGYYWSMPGADEEVRSKELFNIDLVIDENLFRLNPHPDVPDDASFYQAVAAAFNTSAPADIKSGGKAKIVVGITFERNWYDGHSVLDYDDAGETEGVKAIILDAIEADLREIGRRITWLQAAFATDLMSAHLVSRLTGETEFDGKKIFDNPTPDFIEEFLTHVKVNGAEYIRGLGLKVKRIEVKSVDAVGKLADAAEVAAVNQLKREGLLADTDALIDSVEKMSAWLGDDKSMSKKDLINAIQVNEDGSRVEKRIIELAANDIDKLAGILKGILAGVKGNS